MFTLYDQLIVDRRQHLDLGPRVRRLPSAALAQVAALRLDPRLDLELRARADADCVDTMAVVDQALRAYLQVA